MELICRTVQAVSDGKWYAACEIKVADASWGGYMTPGFTVKNDAIDQANDFADAVDAGITWPVYGGYTPPILPQPPLNPDPE